MLGSLAERHLKMAIDKKGVGKSTEVVENEYWHGTVGARKEN